MNHPVIIGMDVSRYDDALASSQNRIAQCEACDVLAVCAGTQLPDGWEKLDAFHALCPDCVGARDRALEEAKSQPYPPPAAPPTMDEGRDVDAALRRAFAERDRLQRAVSAVDRSIADLTLEWRHAHRAGRLGEDRLRRAVGARPYLTIAEMVEAKSAGGRA